MRRKFCVAALTLLAGCGNSNAINELTNKFKESQSLVERLREMSLGDATDNHCFIVGAERIDSYIRRGNAWVYQSQGYKLSAVLEATGLTRQQYEKYVEMLALLSAEKATYCKGGDSGALFSVLVSSKGFCDRTINWSSEPPSAEGRQPGRDFHEISPLINGWYAEIKCS